MAWQTFQLPTIPAPVTSGLDGLKTVAATTATALKAVKTIVEGLSALSTTSLSASQTVIKTAVATIQTAVKSLSEDAGLYVLLVPPRNKVIIPEGVKAALSSSFIATVTPEGLNLQEAAKNPNASTVEAQILKQLFTASSGNAGFVRSVVESFDDRGDPNRPQLGATDAVAGMYIVAGAANIASLIPFTNGMSSLMTPGRPTALDSPSIPVPQGLQARGVSGGDVLLKWTFQQPIVEIPVLETWAAVTEIAIVRSTSVNLLSASTPQELFNTNKLAIGMKSPDGSEVVAVLPYEGLDLKSTYLDDKEHEKGKAYYYTISFRVTLGTKDEVSTGGGTDLGFPRFSNVVKVHFSKENHGTPRTIQGVPPDWYRTPNVASLFPAVGSALSQVAALATQFGDAATGYGDLLKANVKVIEQQIKLYEDMALRLTGAAATLQAFSSINLGAVSMRPFAGTGGVDFVKTDIVKAFGDTTDPNRPPFDNGEFVSGVVLLATTPDAVALLNSLLGVAQTAGSQVAAALEKIDVELAAIEDSLFDDSLQPTHEAVPASPAAAASSGLTGVPQIGESESYCYHSYEPDVAFDDSLQPRS